MSRSIDLILKELSDPIVYPNRLDVPDPRDEDVANEILESLPAVEALLEKNQAENTRRRAEAELVIAYTHSIDDTMAVLRSILDRAASPLTSVPVNEPETPPGNLIRAPMAPVEKPTDEVSPHQKRWREIQRMPEMPIIQPETGPGPFALNYDFGGAPSPQSRDRAAIAAAQVGGGHGEEFFFGLGGGGSILSKLKTPGGSGRGPGMGALASLTGGPRDTNRYAHGKKPGPMGPNPASGKSTGSAKTVTTQKGPNPSGMASANNPAPGRSTDKDQGFAKTGPVDRGPSSGPTVVLGTTGGGGGGSIQVTTPAPNPPADRSSGGTTAKPATQGPNPPPDRSSGGSTGTSTTPKGGGGGASPTPPSGGGSKGPATPAPTTPVETKSSGPKHDPPPPPPPPKEDPHRRHYPNPEDDRGGGGGPRSHGSNPNPEDTGGGGRGGGGPRAYGGQNQNPNPEDQGHGGGGGPRAFGGFSRSNLAGPRSYDAYPDPETTGGGGPRGRYNERPNPEDTGSPSGPRARNRNAIGPWSASKNRMI